MLKLKLQYFGRLMKRISSLEKIMILRKIEGRRRVGWLDSITDSKVIDLSELWKVVENRVAWCPAVCGVTVSRTGLSNWTTTTTPWNRSCRKKEFCSQNIISSSCWGNWLEINPPGIKGQERCSLCLWRCWYLGNTRTSTPLGSYIKWMYLTALYLNIIHTLWLGLTPSFT